MEYAGMILGFILVVGFILFIKRRSDKAKENRGGSGGSGGESNLPRPKPEIKP